MILILTYKRYFTTDQEIYDKSLQLRNEILRKPIGKSLFGENLDLEIDNIFWGAFDNEDIVGTLSYFEKSSGLAQLTAFAVAEGYQKQGIGTTLIQNLILDLEINGFDKVIVHARKSAVEFYTKCGFKVESEGVLNKTLGIIDFEMSYSL